MVADILIITVIAVFAVLAGMAARTYLRFRHVSNRLLALATKEFHDAADSLMKTSEELPDELLDLLEMMDRTAFQKGADRKLLKMVRASSANAGSPPQWLNEIRKPLRELFGKTVASWLNIMMYRHTIAGTLIRAEIAKKELQAGRVSTEAGDSALSTLAGLGGSQRGNGPGGAFVS